uniref:BRICHOS domain-containing protein n=1 Tax=Meloidogyne hapla TaxID=6305 RepID=A0A1I8B2S8_MELHA
MSAKSGNSIISSISSSSCPSTFSSIHSTSTHLPVITTKNNCQFQQSSPFFSSISALNENCPSDYLQQKTSQTSKQSNSGAINWIKLPWQNIQPTSSNINNIGILPPPPYEEKIHRQEYNNNYLNQNCRRKERRNEDIYDYNRCGRVNQNSTKLIFSSAPAPFPLLAQPKTTQRSPSDQSSIPSSVRQQGRLISLRQPDGNVKKKRNRMQEIRDFWNNKPSCRIFCLAILFTYKFVWIAPEQSRFGTEQVITPIHGRLDVGQLGKQARLELTGTPPFRSNFVSILDFQTNHVAILDMSLRSGNSQQQQNRYMLVCFVLDLDRQNIGDLDELLKAAKAGANKLNQLHGWEQNWQFIGIPLNQPPLFQPEIGECRGARWVQLSKTSGDQKSQKCSECFDFCLPDWGIQKDVVRDENYLNILRQICFSLFVPEWRPFAQAPLGGQQKGQIDLYNGQQPNTLMTDLSGKLNAGPTETKWISLQTPINNGLIVDQNRLPSLSNSAFSSPLYFSTNQEQMSPIIGQQSHSRIRNEAFDNNDGRQISPWPSIGERIQKSNEMLPHGKHSGNSVSFGGTNNKCIFSILYNSKTQQQYIDNTKA